MPLEDLSLSIDPTAPPRDVRAFLREANRRIARFRSEHNIPAFVTSDFPRAYGALRSLAAGDTAPGSLFCEWGSGFGVVACLAAMLDFDASGIEIEPALVDAAQELADDFGLPVEFRCGSFIPVGSAPRVGTNDAAPFVWLTTVEDGPREERGLGPADWAVIFAYPWPDEERLTTALFERHAAAGAVLLTYHDGEDLRLRRQT